jgi:Zn-dependent M28 family amino/carboxypeptidase
VIFSHEFIAAKALSQQRPKRSVIVLAVTGEELGLLGSQYYSENPLIPLNKCIFNLNTDKVIVAENLTKRFGHFTAVDHISFEVKRGEIFGFSGAFVRDNV